MRRPAAFFPMVLALGAIILAPAAGARADAQGPIEITQCQTISQPGSYKLVNNLTATGDCIVITAQDVTLDLNGFEISGNGTGSAIVGTGAQVRTVVRNG